MAASLFRIPEKLLHIFRNIRITQSLDDFLCTVDDGRRNACETCDLDSIALIGTALDDLPEKNNVVALFLYSYAVIVDAVDLPFQFRKFMEAAGVPSLLE